MPIIRTAKEDIGREIVANVVALGAVVALTDVVSRESCEKAVLALAGHTFDRPICYCTAECYRNSY